MPSSFQGLAIFFIAALPGATYIWAFERVLGPWGINFSDRVLRFLGVSAAIWTIYLPVGYAIWRYHTQAATDGHPLRWLRQHIQAGQPVPWWLYLAPAAYFFLPAIAGSVVAHGVLSKRPDVRRVALLIAGRDPAPRAWDFLFSQRPYALVRALVKDTDQWVGGLFADNSYAAGYPNSPDLYLEDQYVMADDGSFERDADDKPISAGTTLLLNLDNVRWLEVVELE